MLPLQKSLKTAYRKANLTFSNDVIVVVGDPILDHWPNNLQLPGGALNLYSNLKFLHKPTMPIFPTEKWLNYQFVNNTKISPSVYNVYKPIEHSIAAKTIVCSDYSKGYLNNTFAKFNSKYLFVDTKYGQISKNLLTDSEVVILKATTTDLIEDSLLKTFDYSIITNQQENILVYKSSKIIFEIPVPKVFPLCTVGAGDLFLAVLAFHIHISDSDDFTHLLYSAVKDATTLAAKSVELPYTSNLNLLKENNVYN